jgi:5-methylcytosine-specific restriction endonuclease McrA
VSAKSFCKPHYDQDYYQRTRDKQRARRREWYVANADEVKAKSKAAYHADPERKKAQSRDWQVRHPGYQREYDAKRYAERREELLAQKRAYYVLNRAEMIERARTWAQANPDERRAIQRRWKKTERGRLSDLANAHARLARKRGAPGRATPEQMTSRWNYYGGRCWMCYAVADQYDHVIPLARGGTNWPSNLRPACGPCNQKKWARRHVTNSVTG